MPYWFSRRLASNAPKAPQALYVHGGGQTANGLPYPAVPTRRVLALFALISVASGLSQGATALTRGHAADVGFAFVHAAGIWIPFAVLAVCVIWIARRFPLERRPFARHVPIHFAMYVLMSVTHTSLYLPFARSLLDERTTLSPVSEWPLSLLSNLRGDIFVYCGIVGAYYLYASRKTREISTATSGAAIAGTAPEVVPSTYIARVSFKHEGRLRFIPTADIEVVEADGDYVRIVTTKGHTSVLIRQTLSALHKQLDPAHFVRVHRSRVVRLAAIRELQPMFHGEFVAIMASGTRVKVSRTYRDAAMRSLGVR